MKEEIVCWEDIINECGNYKKGFVTVFLQYEGMPTDERDARNRVVKVTLNGFANHCGIPPSTFKRWVRLEMRADLAQPEAKRARTAKSHANVVKNFASKDPLATVDALMSASRRAQDTIYHELKLRRQGVDTSKAARKGAKVHAHAMVEPIERALASTNVELCVDALREAAEYLQALIDAGALNDRAVKKIGPALEAVQFKWTEVMYTVS
jgi:hypothetical protein